MASTPESLRKACLESAKRFISPSIKQFFTAKVDREYNEFKKSGTKTAAQKYIEEMKELSESLDRVSNIYNTHYDGRSTF